MVTLLTTLKPFRGDDAVRQRNALVSWLALAPGAEVMVFAPCPGLEPLVEELGLRYFPDVPCVEGRLPLVGPMFELAQQEGRHEHQAFVNGDVVLFSDFAHALRRISGERFLMVGRRWGTPVLEKLEPDRPDQWADFRGRVLANGWFARGMEYFGYRRGTLAELPSMCPGASAWDDLMVDHCLRRLIPVVDATRDVLCVHQDHELFQRGDGLSATTQSPAAEWNESLAGGRHLPCIEDATHVLRRGKLQPAWTSLWHLRHRMLRWPRNGRLRAPLQEPVRMLFKLSHRLQAKPGAYYRPRR